MDLTKGEIVHLAASLAEKGKVVTIVSAKHKLIPCRHLIAIDSRDCDAIEKALTEAGFELKPFETCNADFQVRID